MVEEPDRQFSFRGRPRSARDGETLLSALSTDRIPLLHRSIQYHRPQGPLCGIGHCTGCLVRVNGRPNVRACRYEPNPGDSITTENAWPSPTWDLLGTIGLVMPGGVDSLHGLRRPAFATRLYQRFVRRLAGTGEPPTEAASRALSAPSVERSSDVVVVGAGEAGRAVVAALVVRGVHPVVLDRGLHPSPVAGAELIGATTAVFLPPPGEGRERRFTLLAFREPAQGVRVDAGSVVVATGGYDASLLFGGNDRPGVVTADAALALTTPSRSPRSTGPWSWAGVAAPRRSSRPAGIRSRRSSRPEKSAPMSFGPRATGASCCTRVRCCSGPRDASRSARCSSALEAAGQGLGSRATR